MHVIRWLLPDVPAPVLSDDTWLWHRSPAPPRLCPGDWPVMDIFPAASLHRGRRSLSVIDCRNRHGINTRRYQTFPLADDCLPSGVPLTPLMPCKENALCLNEFAMPPLPY